MDEITEFGNAQILNKSESSKQESSLNASVPSEENILYIEIDDGEVKRKLSVGAFKSLNGSDHAIMKDVERGRIKLKKQW